MRSRLKLARGVSERASTRLGKGASSLAGLAYLARLACVMWYTVCSERYAVCLVWVVLELCADFAASPSNSRLRCHVGVL